jgi:hypothetical protein
MISLETSLKHLAWSNQKFFSYFEDQPAEVFALRAADGEWTVGTLLFHIANSEAWFRYCLIGEDWTDYEEIINRTMVPNFLRIVGELDSVLISAVAKPDDTIEIRVEEQIIYAAPSLILSQAVLHGAEHKGQIATILKLHGYHMDLDTLDLWHFMAETKR